MIDWSLIRKQTACLNDFRLKVLMTSDLSAIQEIKQTSKYLNNKQKQLKYRVQPKKQTKRKREDNKKTK